MNVRNRRGIENLLLRRVRRHQSMTALFRAPDTDAARPRPTQARPIVQKQEQDSPVDMPMAEAIPALPVTPTRSNTVARQVAPSSTPAPQPLSPLSLPPSTPALNEPAKTPDPVWKRLQTIFRKHEEHNDPPAAEMETSTTESIQRQVHEEKEPPQVIATGEHILPTHNQETAVPATRTDQRSFENVEPKSVLASPAVQRKVQSLPLTSLEVRKPEPAHSIESKPVLPDKGTDISDQGSTNNEPEKPALPLESVWNVQRVEAQHPLFRENIPQSLLDSTDTDKKEPSIETFPVPEQKPAFGPIQLQRAEDSPTTEISDSLPASEQREESHEPVEILAPSRPRPLQTDLPSKSASIQRQSQDRPASNEVSEAPPVNTAIGPLPADLWWLLGQKPPTAAPASQPEIQRTVEHNQKQVPSEQSNIAHPPVEQPVEAPIRPNTIQRQALSKAPLPSIQKESATSSVRAEETKPAEPDLDDLVRRVYAEVRRRLAAEWERRR